MAIPSSMYFKGDIMIRNRDSRNKEICTMFDIFDFHAFTWKIDNPSLIPRAVDFVVQSPLFHFWDASWILKMYLYGQTEFQTQGYIDIIIERLNSQTPISDELFCKMYWKNASNEEFNPKVMKFAFDSQWTYSRVHRFMESPLEYNLKDPLILVFEFGICGLPENTSDCHAKNAVSAVGQQVRMEKMLQSPEIGEVFSEYLDCKTFGLKFHDFPFTPIPADYHAPSPQFSFANALWILKAVPYYTELSSERKICVILERLQSKIPEQNIILSFLGVYPFHETTDRSILFNSSHSEEEVLNFPCDICLFSLNIRIKIKTTVVESTIGHGSLSRSSGVLQNFKNLFLNQEDFDIIIRVKGVEFRAHKLILKVQSPVFSALFRNDMQEKVTGIINIEDCEPSTFQDFLCFLYCGEVRKLSAKTAFNLFVLADKYNVSDLRSLCMEFIKINLSIDTFSDTMALALLHSESDPQLFQLSRDFLKENLQKIMEADKWKSFAVQNPELSNEIKALVPDKIIN